MQGFISGGADLESDAPRGVAAAHARRYDPTVRDEDALVRMRARVRLGIGMGLGMGLGSGSGLDAEEGDQQKEDEGEA